MVLLVGIFSKVQRILRYSDSAGYPEDALAVVSSPWSTGAGLAAVLGLDNTGAGVVSEEQALAVPSVFRALAQYTAAVAPLKLETSAGSAPWWMNHTHGAGTPGERLSDIIRDLIFHAASLLVVQRTVSGEITDAMRVPHGLWSFDFLNRITIDGLPVEDQTSFVLVKSYMPSGFLEYAAESVRHYHDLRNIIRARGKNPIPLIELHVDGEADLTTEELQRAQTAWSAARQADNGAVAITPSGITAKVHPAGNSDNEMLVSARNAVRLDMANFMNMDAALVDGASGRSMDYENTLQSTSEFVRLSLPLWLEPIQQRFSQDDVTPDGVTVTFNTSTLDPIASDSRGNIGTATSEGITS